MPTKAQLMDADKAWLVRLIEKAGGFLEVAQELGLRSRQRPPGKHIMLFFRLYYIAIYFSTAEYPFSTYIIQ